ncbi:hypothetical protein ACJX0J_041751, partial [Zea mays]
SCISLPNLAHSFTDSCSPKPARDKRTAPVQYNLRKKHAKTTSTNHTGLGLEPRTGDIAADDSYWGTQEGDPSPQGSQGKPPPFLDELYTLFGRLTTHDRGNLISARGVREPLRNYGSRGTPDDDVGCSSKRIREATMDSPPKAKRMSLEDHIANISDCVSIRSQLDLKKTLNHGNEEVVEVVRLLKEDGIEEDSDLYCMANILCKNDINRKFFLQLTSKEGRLHWISFECVCCNHF